ncbi:MAG: glycerophosphodiester phosphodiesterase [Clostridiales bacterium]|nr:glycerophosphodiester phosphodiesterase [Clostridiales bacterium]
MKIFYKTIVSILMGIVLLFGIVQLIPVKKVIENNPFAVSENNRPLIIAHGGAKDLFPENTMVAFDGSVKIGVDMLEIDVCLTKDDVLITHHDKTIDAMSNGSGEIRNYTFNELKAFNFGDGFKDLDGNNPYADTIVSVTKLSDVFEKYPNLLYNVEIKDKGETGEKAASILYQLIIEYDLKDKILVPSFSDDIINDFRSLTNNSILTSSAREETKKYIYFHLAQIDNLLFDIKFEAMQLPLSDSGVNLATKAIINDAHRRNIAIHYWTIDDKETMKDLILKGVDGIITDRPDLLNEVMDELGY